MMIENPEALKSWLTAVLAPLCDADPAALAKYVLALAKKEKPESELRQAMCEQLDVFLQQETTGFVEKLFATLESKSYLQSNPEPPAKPEANEQDLRVTNCLNAPSLVAALAPTLLPTVEPRSRRRERSKDRRRSYSPKSRSRSRSRDRERDRSRRSRSRDRTRDRLGRSLHDERRGRRSPARRSDRRRSRSPRKASRSPRRRIRSPHTTSSSYESGPPPAPVVLVEPVVQAVAANVAPIQSVVVAPSANALDRQKFRCRDYDEKGFCMRGDLCPYDHGVDPVVLEDVELSSMLNYNRPPPQVGAPPGPPPVRPLSHLQGPPPSLPPPGEAYNPDAPAISWPPPPIGGPGLVGLRPLGPPPPFGQATHRLPPPHLRMRSMLPPRGPPPMGLGGPISRELISVSTDDEHLECIFKRNVKDANRDANLNYDSNSELASKKGRFDYNRLGSMLPQQEGNPQQHNQRRYDPQNCCLEVKKIPKGLNNISMLNNHFSKFGKIVNLQVCFSGDPEGALITYSSHAEAQAAYRSSEAVLNNRFIKVFWHNKESTSPEMKGKQENVPPNIKAPVKERLGGHPARVLSQSQTSASVDEVALKEANEAKEKEREKALEAIKRNQEMLAAKEALKKKKEEQKREAAKLQVDLQRRKQELLDKQLQQQRVLIERLEKNKSNMKPDERASVMQTVRNLQETIEKLKKDLQLTTLKEMPSASQTTSSTTSLPAKTPEQARKEMLDVEIELYQKQMEGTDTTQLQLRVQELNSIISQSQRGHPSLLRRCARAVGGSLRARGRGLAARGRGRARGFYVGPHVSVDRRPTQLKITGFESQQHGDVLAHFANFGDVVDYQIDEQALTLVIRYKSRKDAELALVHGRNFSGSSLVVEWNSPLTVSQIVKDTSQLDEDESNLTQIEERGAGEDDGQEDEGEVNEGLDDLLNYDEDDDDEERSWRR